jgi:uncharacterized protein (TIGR02594 family)
MHSRLTWFAMAEDAIDELGFTPPVNGPVPAAPEPVVAPVVAPDVAPPAPAAPPAPEVPAPATSIAALLGGRELQMGDEGPAVRAVQLALAKLGYGLKGSGYFGGNTDTAVTDFQERNDLEIDGVVGEETATALDLALAALASGAAVQPGADGGNGAVPGLAALVGDMMLQSGDQGEVVRAVQRGLAKLGYGLKGTGCYGGKTEQAVIDFQRSHQIEVDGVVGPETAKAIDVAIGAIGSTPEPVPAPPPGVAGQDGSNRPLWLIEGLKWVGTRERVGPGSNPEILGWARGEGGEIAKSYRDDAIPWCALYANMVLTKVGLKGTKSLWALDWDDWGRKLAGPAVGSFAPMKRDGGGHIVIVVGRDQHGNLMCLGGNQSDQVSIIPFPKARPLSFRWPSEVDPPSITGFDRLPEVRSDGHVSIKEA